MACRKETAWLAGTVMRSRNCGKKDGAKKTRKERAVLVKESECRMT